MSHPLLQRYQKRTMAYQRLFLQGKNEPNPNATLVLQDLAKKSGAWAGKGATTLTSFVPGDPYVTAFNEGKRYLFNYLAYQLHLTPHDLNQLIQEQDDADRS
jgi:hypothetical protein